ncbi:rhodanese-like domain-containing protein [Mucilaginibacter sp.]|uniref:rhodanese-like domain-containing protein n=1 Tax=Mucilaginibacter sp. TaxID=1882438 RepID=UPI0025D46F22|nr:rhodanese-like domain-containing protein [Mucilaginibacter sp.]
MRSSKIYTLILLTVFACFAALKTHAQISNPVAPSLTAPNPWTDSQLLEPSVLAAQIKTGGTNLPLILNIGAVEDIKGATHIGAVNDAKNLEKLKSTVATLPKSTAIIIYCGCCPFAKCPNIRPAFSELIKAGFTNVKLLNLSTNLKTNWVAKGYPLAGNN